MTYCVIYQSNTGFTKQYAEWIAESLCCTAEPLQDFGKVNIQQVDTLIYGGWICADCVSGLSTLQKFGRTPDIVFAVGAAPQHSVDLRALSKKNNLGRIPFFYYQGGIRYEKLGFTQKGMLKMYALSLKKKTDKTKAEIQIEKALARSYDAATKDAIVPLVEKCMALEMPKMVNGGE